LTGYQTPLSDWYNCLLVPLEGETTLQVCDFEVGLAMLHTTLTRIEHVRWNRMEEAAGQLTRLLKGERLDGRRVGLETGRPGLNVEPCERLRAEFPRARFGDAATLVPPIRAVKSPAELECLRQAARFSVAGMEAAVAAMRPGITENDVAAAAAEAMIRAGS